ncbi:hypothetical protein IW141_002464 [Coemansia sp. RSA 355]|nr:hypothetical protein IW141_002464 [Coemansia sp. RSA 355]
MSQYLTEELAKIGIDDEAIVEYCAGLLSDTTMDDDEKREAVTGYLEAVVDTDVTAIITKELELTSAKTADLKAAADQLLRDKLSEAHTRERAEFQRDMQAATREERHLTLDERKRREAFLKKYGYGTLEVVEKNGETEIVYRETNDTVRSEGNDNAKIVADKEQFCMGQTRHSSSLRTVEALVAGIRQGDRASLARGITLVESTRSDHQQEARKLVSECIKIPRPRSLRIGLTGTPGVGKSTFIESLGMRLLQKGHRVSVLAVDPSSTRSGGSILGDKTRMQELSAASNAYVRPSPNRGSLGGVARNTLDSIILTEACGFDVCLVETVGVGQSETMVSDMVDMFVLLMQPGSGDELQGVKRGIMELADLVVVNKADGAMELAAKLTRSEIVNALHLMIPRRESWSPKVVRASAATGYNLDRVWSTVLHYFDKLEKSGEWDALRADQRRKWMWREVSHLLLARLDRNPASHKIAQLLEADVLNGSIPAGVAAEQIVSKFLSNP